MSAASDFFRDGALDEAIAAATDLVKSRPGDIQYRSFLAELLCFDGQLDRADTQLETIGKLTTEVEAGVKLFRGILRGEIARRALFETGAVPEIAQPLDARLQGHFAGIVASREGDLAGAARCFAEAEAIRPAVPVTCDGTPFADFRDLDDLFAPVIEIITSDGRYFWIPTDALESLTFVQPTCPRDLLWRPVEMSLKDGKRGDVFMPALYPFVAGSSPGIRLGRATDWVGEEGEPVRGRGRRLFIFDDEDRDSLAIERIDFGPEN